MNLTSLLSIIEEILTFQISLERQKSASLKRFVIQIDTSLYEAFGQNFEGRDFEISIKNVVAKNIVIVFQRKSLRKKFLILTRIMWRVCGENAIFGIDEYDFNSLSCRVSMSEIFSNSCFSK